MNTVFVDTSALLALLNPDDEHHGQAVRAFEDLRSDRAELFTTSFVLVETYALLGRRLGLAAVKRFREDFAPLVDVLWVGESLHEAGLDLLLARHRRQLSLADGISFVAMRQQGADQAFAIDPHFEQEGFRLVG
jgi:predicted nucleic acid-binding protein